MKITFFLIAFCLVFIRLYLGWTGHWRHEANGGTMTISNGDDNLDITWSGKINLNDDETAIESMTPGGFLKYKHNDEKLFAESNLQGDIRYTMYDGQHDLTLNEEGKKFLAKTIHGMIELGFDADGRIDRLYKRGGKVALLNAAEELKSEDLKGRYIDRILKSDSLTKVDFVALIKLIGEGDQDYPKEQNLNRFNAGQLKDSTIVETWLGAVDHVGDDHEKSELLKHLIDQDTLTEDVEGRILGISGHIGSDWEKENLLSQLLEKDTISLRHYDQLLAVIGQIGDDHGKADLISQLIQKDSIPVDHFEKLMGVIDHIGSDFEKQNLYKKLIEKNGLTDGQWISLIKTMELIGSDFDKTNLLVEIAKKMPSHESLKTAYLTAAKTINSDEEYGKALRAVE
jgi:hypothetical protein